MTNQNYQLLDSGQGRKLEQVGPYRLIRPAAQAIWPPRLPQAEWKSADAEFVRDSAQHGTWHGRKSLPLEWDVNIGSYPIICRTTEFGHLGFFPEQLENWRFIESFCKAHSQSSQTPKVLNLFAYTGLASRAAACGGAEVVHVDASKTTVSWGRESQSKFEPESKIRWIVDDVIKFVDREIRRGHHYQGIILDPPTYGRGPKGGVWKVETDLAPLMKKLESLVSPDFGFVLLSCHSPGVTVASLANLLEPMRKKLGASFACRGDEMLVPESSQGIERSLPSGVYCQLVKTNA